MKTHSMIFILFLSIIYIFQASSSGAIEKLKKDEDRFDKIYLISETGKLNNDSSTIYAARIRPYTGNNINYFIKYNQAEFVGMKPLYKAELSVPDDSFINASIIEKYYIKLKFPKKVKIKNVNFEFKNKFDMEIIILATSHALSLVSLDLWDGDWGTGKDDSYINKIVHWFKIGAEGKIEEDKFVNNFKELKKYAKRDDPMRKNLDGKPVFKYFAEYFQKKDFVGFKYLILIKDNWDVASDGLPDFKNQVKISFKTGSDFDILTTKSFTTGIYYLMGLAGELNGRVFESKSSDNIDEKDLYDYSGRINGKIRARFRETAKSDTNKTSIEENVSEIIIRADDPYFQSGNLLYTGQSPIMIYFFQELLSVVNNNELMMNSPEALKIFIQNLKKIMTVNPKSEKMTSLFKEWFNGFQLPAPIPPIDKKSVSTKEYPFAEKDLMQLLKYCHGAEGKKYIERILSDLEEIFKKEDQPGMYFIPDEVFILEKSSP
ncbi:hypothetical protein HY745_09080 [Candidatus Desantisbacteria bacterium]|nr:hypothetical protein [Candidatus Desantisbacteria bacterium]